jgi:hypothetical protein
MKEITEGIFKFKYVDRPFTFEVTTDNKLFVKARLLRSSVVVPIPPGVTVEATAVAKDGDKFLLKYGMRLVIRKIKAKLLRHISRELNRVVKPIYGYLSDTSRDPEFPDMESTRMNQKNLDMLKTIATGYDATPRKKNKKKSA